MKRVAVLNSQSVDVLFEENWHETAPKCPHGPTLLFETFTRGNAVARRHYGCSASRNKAECNKFTTTAVNLPTYKQVTACKIKTFCVTCQVFILKKEDVRAHKKHLVKKLDSEAQFANPSKFLLEAAKNNQFKAQYFLTDQTLAVLFKEVCRLEYTHLICIGMPRLHEAVQSLKSDRVKSFFLDIDERYTMFWPKDVFARFNMFNHYFFDDHGENSLKKFIGEKGKFLIVTDPPFGGRIDCLDQTFQWISSSRKKLINLEEKLDIMMIFPYYTEKKITEVMNGFEMSDYVFQYDNHKKFHSKSSPVRMFTNICLKTIVLPTDQGYRFCKSCSKYVLNQNRHCVKCNTCPSKNGRPYVHCDKCGFCVKPNQTHCVKCGMCRLKTGHECLGKMELKCHICGDKNHRRKFCPHRIEPTKSKKPKLE